MLVDGVSIPEGDFSSRKERMEAYHRKFLAAIHKDTRVLLIKLADRLHNLSTCHSLSREAQVKNVRETEEFYIPLAKEHGAPHKDLEEIVVSIKKRLKIE
jgi:(p)ppGpp synthase/HD superfamily hydrolase